MRRFANSCISEDQTSKNLSFKHFSTIFKLGMIILYRLEVKNT